MRSFSAVAGVLLAGVCLSLSASAPTFLPARLVVDLNSVPVALDSAPTAACTQGDTAYFQATDANSMVGLWKSDGTSAGTTQVLQMGPSGGQAYIHCFGFSSTGLAYFWGSDTTHGQQLWRSDGTAAGTLMLSGFTVPSFTTPALLAFLPNGAVIFQVDDQVHGNELWVSDGTAAGTHLILDLTPGSDGSYFWTGATYGGDYYFGFNGNPWKTDGTAGGTRKIADIGTAPGSYSPNQFVALSIGVLFVGTTQGPGGELWLTDGNTATRVTNSFPTAGNTLAIDGLQSLGSKAILRVTAPGSPPVAQLWVTDATSAGTRQLKASVSLQPLTFMASFAGHAVFTAKTATAFADIWATDGTESGTLALNTSNPPSAGVVIAQSYVTTNNLVYAIATSPNNYETWVTNATPGGTRKLGTFSPGSYSDGLVMATGDAKATYILNTTGAAGAVSGSRATLRRLDGQSGALSVVTQLDVTAAQPLTPLNGKSLFINTTPGVGQEPWVSDGTAAGTHVLRDIAPSVRNGDSIPFVFAQLPAFALMRADDGVHGAALWRTDGTASGTKMVSSVVAAESLFGGGIPAQVLNGRVIFAGNDGAHGTEPWVTDGTAAGTMMLADINQGVDSSIPNSSYPAECGVFVTMGGYAYFGARMFSLDGALWRTDGTVAGTTYIGTFRWSRNYTGSDVCVVAQMNGSVFFLAETPPDGDIGLWKTDGTAAGTTQVSTSPLVITSKPVVANGYLYFVANAGSGNGIYRSDGTPAGTGPFVVPASSDAGYYGPYQPVVAGNYVFYIVCNSSNICTAYSVDQTTGQRTALAEVGNTTPPSWAPLGNKVIFQGKSAGTGIEPWVTDGTPAGTHMLVDTVSGSADGSPVSFINFNGLMYFTIQRPDPGQIVYEYWRTDGTTAGTVRIDNLPANPIPYGLNVTAGVFGQHLLFDGSDGSHGLELWSLDNAQPVLNADTATTPSDVALTIDVLANDVDSDGTMDPASTQIVQQPSHGTATVVPGTGAIQYTATAGYVGPDSLTYVASDVQQYAGAAAATVSVTVTEPVGNGGGGGSGTGGGSGSSGGGSGSGGSGGSGSGGSGGTGSGGSGDGADTGGDKGGGGGGAIEPYMLLMLVLVLLGREPIERSCCLLVLTKTRARGGIERRWVGRSLRR